MVMFLLPEAKRRRVSRVDCLIPEQPATLRRVMFEHTSNVHPKFPCLTPFPKLLLVGDASVQRQKGGKKNEKPIKDSKSC